MQATASSGANADFDETRLRAMIAPLARLEGAALPMLHAVQHAFGYVDGRAMALVAEALNLSRAEVYGLVAFYPDFSERPASRRDKA